MVSIIILSFNTKDLLRECLYSVYSHIKEIAFEVIVVDNASSDDSVAMIQKEYPQVKLQKSKENLGFGKGINLGVNAAKGDFLLFLNSDTRIRDSKLKQMIELMNNDQQIGIIGGQLKNADGSMQRSYGKFYTLSAVAVMLFGGEKREIAASSAHKIHPTDWVSGGYMFIRKTVFEEIGKFDENIFMYMEDMEICYRAKQKGYSVMVCHFTDVLHMGHGSSNRSFAIINIYKGVLYFYKKHKSHIEYQLVKLLLQIKGWTAIIIGTVTRNTYLVTTYKKALEF